MNINKLLKDYPRLLERIERLEVSLSRFLETNRVDTAPTAVTLAPIVSEHSLATTGESIGNETGKGNRRRPSRRN